MESVSEAATGTTRSARDPGPTARRARARTRAGRPARPAGANTSEKPGSFQHLELYGKDPTVTDDWDFLQQDLRSKVSEVENFSMH